MKVFLTGATGFVGSEVLRQLVAAGYEVRALVRPGSEGKLAVRDGVEIRHGDATEAATLAGALAGCEAAGFLESLGLPAALAARHPRDLSSGQRRRLALGLVLRSARPLLLVDERTVALDGPGRRLVRDLLAGVPATFLTPDSSGRN